jgi:hypothetical protein
MSKANLRPDVIERITAAYKTCALWSSADGDGTSLDSEKYASARWTKAALRTMEDDVRDFVSANKAALEASGLDDEQIGHDFWLTRNGHGAGFWDRGLGSVGDELTKAAEAHGSQDLYIVRGWIYAQ